MRIWEKNNLPDYNRDSSDLAVKSYEILHPIQLKRI